MKKVWILFAVLLTGVFLTACNKEVDQGHAYVSVDINPSFEIMTDEDGLIIEVIGLNEDADVVLYNVDVKGKKLDEGLKLMVKESYDLGFIKGERNIVIGVEKQENKQALINHLHNVLSEMKALKLKVHTEFKAGVSALLDELKQEADKLEMSLGQYRMALRLKAIDAEVTFESIKTLPIQEINARIREKAFMVCPPRLELRIRLESYRDYLSRNLLRKARIVDALGQFILKTDPAYFDAYIGEVDIKAEALVNLYHDYLTELQRVIVLMADEDFSELIDKIHANEEFIALELELKELYQKYETLMASYMVGDKTDVYEEIETVIKAIKHLEEKITILINDIIDDETLEGFYHRGKIIIRRRRPIENPYIAIREKYALKFSELGFSIDTYEKHVLDYLKANTLYATIKAEFEALVEELKAEFEALKEIYLAFEIEYELHLKERSLYLKAQMKHQKGQ